MEELCERGEKRDVTSREKSTEEVNVNGDAMRMEEVGDVEEPEVRKVEEPEVGDVEEPEVGDVEEPEVGQVEEPEVRQVEEPEVRQVEDPEVRQVEESEVRQVEEPEVRQVEEPEVRKVEEPEVRKVEEPEVRQVEEPEVRQVEEPEVRQVEEPEVSQVEEPEVSQVEEPEVRQVEEPEVRQVEEPEVRQVEEPEVRQVEEPEVRQVEEPEVRQLEEPEVRQLEEPEVRQVEEPEVMQVEEPEVRQLEEPEVIQVEEPEVMQVEEPELIQVEEPEVRQVAAKHNCEDHVKEANMWILDYFIHMAKAVFIKGEKYRFQLLYDIMGGVMELPLVICPKMARQLRCLQVMNHCIETPHYEGVNQEKKREKLANEIFELLLRSGIVEDGDTEELRNIQNKFCSPCGLFETWKKQLVQRFLEFNLPSEHEPQLLKAVRCSLEERVVTKEANDNKTDEPEYSSSDDTNRLARRMIKAAFCSLFDDSQDSLETFEPLEGLQRSQSPSAGPAMEGPSHKKSDRPTNSGVSTPANVLMEEEDETDLNFSENRVMESPPNVRSSLPEEAAAQSEMASVVAGGQSSNSVRVATKAKLAKPTLSPPVNHTSLVHKDKAKLKRMRAGTTSHSVDNLPQSAVKRKIYFDSLFLQQSSLASSSDSSEGLDYLHDKHDFKRMRQRMYTATEEKSTWSDEEANFPATKKTLDDLAKGTKRHCKKASSKASHCSSFSRTKKTVWTSEETQWIREGVLMFGIGKWASILDSFPFVSRTSVMLKDRWRTMKKLGIDS